MNQIKLYQGLEDCFEALARFAEEMRQRFSYCGDCGKNRYFDKPCIGGNDGE